MEPLPVQESPHADEPERRRGGKGHPAQRFIRRIVESHGAEELHTSRSDREKARFRFLSDGQSQGRSSRRSAHRRGCLTTASRLVPYKFVNLTAPIEITLECGGCRLAATHRPPNERRRYICE